MCEVIPATRHHFQLCHAFWAQSQSQRSPQAGARSMVLLRDVDRGCIMAAQRLSAAASLEVRPPVETSPADWFRENTQSQGARKGMKGLRQNDAETGSCGAGAEDKEDIVE